MTKVLILVKAATFPAPPEGFAYVVDADGKYVVDADGAYILAEV